MGRLVNPGLKGVDPQRMGRSRTQRVKKEHQNENNAFGHETLLVFS
jgi:hypothetical protein